VRISPRSLKRYYVFCCDECERAFQSTQVRLRTKRTYSDWEQVTVPIDAMAILADVMPEQNPGKTRTAIRSFINSGSSVAVVPNVIPEGLQRSIEALGLQDAVYAEQRDHQTVIRRIEQ